MRHGKGGLAVECDTFHPYGSSGYAVLRLWDFVTLRYRHVHGVDNLEGDESAELRGFRHRAPMPWPYLAAGLISFEYMVLILRLLYIYIYLYMCFVICTRDRICVHAGTNQNAMNGNASVFSLIKHGPVMTFI